MKKLMKVSSMFVAALVLGLNISGFAAAAEAERHVVDAGQIQARIDQKVAGESADRETIQLMLQRPEVRALAGQAGLDLQRAGAAVAVLSGPELASLAAQAAEVNAGMGGGDNIVISATALIIILLIIIIVAN